MLCLFLRSRRFLNKWRFCHVSFKRAVLNKNLRFFYMPSFSPPLGCAGRCPRLQGVPCSVGVWDPVGRCALPCSGRGPSQCVAAAPGGEINQRTPSVSSRSSQQVGRSAGQQVGRSAGRQASRSAGRQVGRSAVRQVGMSAGRQVGRSAGRQLSRSACGRSASQQVGKSAHRQVGKSAGR